MTTQGFVLHFLRNDNRSNILLPRQYGVVKFAAGHFVAKLCDLLRSFRMPRYARIHAA